MMAIPPALLDKQCITLKISKNTIIEQEEVKGRSVRNMRKGSR